MFGSLAGLVWSAGGWSGVLALTLPLTAAVLVLALVLRGARSLDPGRS